MIKPLKIYYNPKQVCEKYIEKSVSKSPLKPKMVAEKIKETYPESSYEFISDFEPFDKNEFIKAHTEEYVDKVYNFNQPGEKLCSSLPWSEELVRSLEYTNASLYEAIKGSILNPEFIHLSCSSGFHHSTPDSGYGFCTFSGQCIASLKIYEETCKVGCYLDLDAHYGNSIEDTRKYNPLINECIPKWANHNPEVEMGSYIEAFTNYLENVLTEKILNNECHYVVYCHGADSIDGDDLKADHVSLNEWFLCTKIFWTWHRNISKKLGRSFPVSMSLFGGYRKNDYEYVINAHVNDIRISLQERY